MEYQPQAKFIVALRNPVDMCISLHGQAIRGDYAFNEDFAKSWKHSLELNRNKKSLSPKQKYLQNYIDRCMLGQQCKKLINEVHSDSVHFVIFDELKKAPRKVYLETLGFIGVEDDGRFDFPVENSGFMIKYPFLNKALSLLGKAKRKMGLHSSVGLASKLQRMNSREGGRVEVEDKLKAEMKEIFQNDILELEKITKKDLGLWR